MSRAARGDSCLADRGVDERRLGGGEDLAPAADLYAELRVGVDEGRDQRHPDPLLQGRREGARGDLAEGYVGDQADEHPGPRDAALEGHEAAEPALRALLLLLHQDIATPERVLLPADGPAEAALVGGDVDGDVLAVQGVAH